MQDQADKLRQLVRKVIKEHPRLEPGIPFVVISGGAEGVGTTTTTIQLAQELAQLGKRVVLVDANFQQPDIARKIGVETRGSITDILSGSRSAVEVLETVNESIHLLPGRWIAAIPPVISHEAVTRLFTELRMLQSQADVAIIDAGYGMSPWISQLWRAAHEILLVTSSSSANVTESYSVVKHSPHTELAGKLRLIINQGDDRDLIQQIGSRFATTCQQFLNLSINETIAIASSTETDTTRRLRGSATRLSSAFERSVRLLAAEILTSCLVLSSPKQPTISRKMTQTANKIQTV